MTEEVEVKVDTTEAENEAAIQQQVADDPLLELLKDMNDKDKEIMVNAITALQSRNKELEADMILIKTESTNSKKAAIIDRIAKAGFDTKEYAKYTLEQLEAIAATLGQKNKAIQVTTIKKDDPNEFKGATVMIPGKGHVAFTKRFEQKSDK